MHNIEELIKSLQVRGRIETEQRAAEWTWLATGGLPLFTFYPESMEDLSQFLKNRPSDLCYRTFGAASNVLVRDGDKDGKCFDGAFIRLMKGFRALSVDGTKIIAQAGLPGSFIVNKALEAELGGLSFMSTIPGNLGGLIAMNAGAHGSEMKDIIEWVEVLDPQGNLQRLSCADCGFSYRHSSIPKNHIIVRACINTKKSTREEITSEIHHFLAQRKATQPTGGKMAGCFFKNPPEYTGYKAWQLIRGANIPANTPASKTVCVSPIHANFIMNQANASAFDLEYFALQIQADIFFNKDIWLEIEIERIGYGG